MWVWDSQIRNRYQRLKFVSTFLFSSLLISRCSSRGSDWTIFKNVIQNDELSGGQAATFACLYFSFPINANAVAPEIPQGEPHPLEYNRNAKQYLLPARNWQLRQKSPLVTQQSLTRLCVCGGRGGVLLKLKTDRNMISSEVVALDIHSKKFALVLGRFMEIEALIDDKS